MEAAAVHTRIRKISLSVCMLSNSTNYAVRHSSPTTREPHTIILPLSYPLLLP